MLRVFQNFFRNPNRRRPISEGVSDILLGLGDLLRQTLSGDFAVCLPFVLHPQIAAG
jgi:hypothetical protein